MLYRGDLERFRAQIATWPADIRLYVEDLLG
jgi:hypothetical protein